MGQKIGVQFLYWFERIVCSFPSEGDVYKAQTPAKEAQEAPEVKEDPDMKVELPVDQVGNKGWYYFDSVVSAPTSIPTSALPLSSPWPLEGSVYDQLATYSFLEFPCQTFFWSVLPFSSTSDERTMDNCHLLLFLPLSKL